MPDPTLEERVVTLEIQIELLERQLADLTQALTTLATKIEGNK